MDEIGITSFFFCFSLPDGQPSIATSPQNLVTDKTFEDTTFNPPFIWSVNPI